MFAFIGCAFVILLLIGFMQDHDGSDHAHSDYDENASPDRQQSRALAPHVRESEDGLLPRENAVEPLPPQTPQLEAMVELDIQDAFVSFNAATTGEVSIDIQDGIILLHGSLNTAEASLEAERIAVALSRGIPVENNILVKDIDPQWAD